MQDEIVFQHHATATRANTNQVKDVKHREPTMTLGGKAGGDQIKRRQGDIPSWAVGTVMARPHFRIHKSTTIFTPVKQLTKLGASNSRPKVASKSKQDVFRGRSRLAGVVRLEVAIFNKPLIQRTTCKLSGSKAPLLSTDGHAYRA